MAVDITPSALLEFAKTITGRSDSVNNSRIATVTRIDKDGVAYVSLPGGVDETPIATAGAMFNVGDTVYLTMSGGRLRADYNLTAPSIGARVVKTATAPIKKAVKVAKQAADEAGKVANAVNQHFWTDDNGAHVTDVTQDEWKKAVDDGFSDLSADKQYPNLLENSLGILLRSALNNLVSITRSAIAFYDGSGNDAANMVAQFGTAGAQIGYADETHAEIDYHSMQLVDKEGNTYFHVSDIRDENGSATLVDKWTGDGTTKYFYLSNYADSNAYTVYKDGVALTSGIVKYISSFALSTAPSEGSVITVTYSTSSQLAKGYTLGLRGEGNIGALSVAEGAECTASAICAHAEGNASLANGMYSHAEGNSVASGIYSHSEGSRYVSVGSGEKVTTASGECSHAEGKGTTASGDSSHAEGKGSIAIGANSHAEGGSHAIGSTSHAEGTATYANGTNSHAQNLGTIASSYAQTAIGKYNVDDASDTYALIVGNGTADNARSNALTLGWDGTLFVANGYMMPYGSQIWDNSNRIIHMQTPDAGTAQAEFTFEPDGKIYSRKRSRSSASSPWGSWSSWATIAG